MIIKTNLSILVGIGFSAIANNAFCHTPPCQSLATLSSGIDFKQYQQCQIKIKACIPAHHRVADDHCLIQTKTQPQCKQLLHVATLFNSQFSSTIIEKIPHSAYLLVTATSTADGISRYAVITPNHQLTALYPKKQLAIQKLHQQYPQGIPLATQTPQFKWDKDNQRLIIKTAYNFNDGCIACRPLARLDTHFIFNSNGSCSVKTTIQPQ